MTCAFINVLIDLYAENRLISFQARWIENHIALCPKCAAELAAWKKMMRGLRTLPALYIPVNLKAALKTALTEPEAVQTVEVNDENFAPWPDNVPALAFAFSLLAFLICVSRSNYGPGIPSQACSDN